MMLEQNIVLKLASETHQEVLFLLLCTNQLWMHELVFRGRVLLICYLYFVKIKKIKKFKHKSRLPVHTRAQKNPSLKTILQTTQPADQPSNQPTNQATNQATDRPNNQPTDQPTN